MPPFFSLVSHIANIASILSFPALAGPLIIWWVWKYAKGDMQRRYKIVLGAIMACGLVASGIDMLDRFVFTVSPTARIRLHYTAASPTPEIIQSDNIFMRPASFQFDQGGAETGNVNAIKWTLVIVQFAKPVTAHQLRIIVEGGGLHWEQKNFTERSAMVLFSGPIADKIIDIEAIQ